MLTKLNVLWSWQMSPVTYTQHKYRPLFLDTGWLGMPSQQGSLLAIRKKGESQTKSATELRLKPLICCQMIQIYVESTMVESNSKSWYPNSWKTDVRPFRWCQNAITHSHMKHGETLLIPVGWLIRRAKFWHLSMFSPKFDLVACKSHKTTPWIGPPCFPRFGD